MMFKKLANIVISSSVVAPGKQGGVNTGSSASSTPPPISYPSEGHSDAWKIMIKIIQLLSFISLISIYVDWKEGKGHHMAQCIPMNISIIEVCPSKYVTDMVWLLVFSQ